MSNISHDYIEEYIRGLIKEPEGHLNTMLEYATREEVPIIHPEVGQFLKVLIKSHNVKRVLEVGTAIGYSAALMAEAAGEGCKIITIERDENMKLLAEENINKLGYDDKIEIKFGDALEVLKTIEGDFDLVFLDAAKGHYDHFLPLCLKHLRTKGLLVCDNVLFRGMVANNKLLIRRKITIVKRMRKYLTHISDMKELDTVVLPIGDGIAFSCKLLDIEEVNANE